MYSYSREIFNSINHKQKIQRQREEEDAMMERMKAIMKENDAQVPADIKSEPMPVGGSCGIRWVNNNKIYTTRQKCISVAKRMVKHGDSQGKTKN